MSRTLRLVALAFLAVLIVPGVFAQSDKPGTADFPGIARMPSFFITGVKDSPFDAFTFPVLVNGRNVPQKIEGHYEQIRYDLTKGVTPPSPLQILRNYENAARAAGGKVMSPADSGDMTFKLAKGGKEIWCLVHIASTGSGTYYLNIVEKQLMQQDVVIDAKAMGDGLAANGHIAIEGIHFDFGKSEVKPESKPAIDEMVSLLKQNPALKLWVVGHTDAVGSPEANVTLSNARASAVVKELVKAGIDARRLSSFGAGPYAAVATNDTEEGRAQNRRVELVKHP